VVLPARARQNVAWSLPVEALAFVDASLDRVLEAGRFEIHVGQSADPREHLIGTVELVS
jgi:hypothetical protein